MRRQCRDPKGEAGAGQGAAPLPAWGSWGLGSGVMVGQAMPAGHGGEPGMAPGSAAEPWPGAQGVCSGEDPSVPGGGEGWSPAGSGACGDGAVLCCSSRRVGGVVPVEPVLGDLRARGQDQDAAVRGPAARRESLRGPRAAGQALQYRELPRSVPSSPLAPPSFPPGNARTRHRPRARAVLPARGCGACEGRVAPPWGAGTARGCCDVGCTLLSPLETPMESRLRRPCRGAPVLAAGRRRDEPGDHGGATSFPPRLPWLTSPRQAQRWHRGGTGT